ncbi:methyl-accepting chemotaxis protein II [Escherichia coli]|uniref:Methyl-accepting chemotaxis protein II n=1 Tax=Escherichia coli TaxID=562 RepID=A0A377A2X0_ECOLX|nr:methyl-accepting chemotaxis protein II [Escherichia coli]
MVVLILLVAWYGIRRMLLTPLAKIIAHIREIAGGNLANTLTIDGAVKWATWRRAFHICNAL